MDVTASTASNPVITMQHFRALATYHSLESHTDKIPCSSLSCPEEPGSRISVLKAMIMYVQLLTSKNNKVDTKNACIHLFNKHYKSSVSQ